MTFEIVADGAATSFKISAFAVMLVSAALCTGWKLADLYFSILERVALYALKSFRTWWAEKSAPIATSSLVRRPWPSNIPPPKRQTAPASRRRH